MAIKQFIKDNFTGIGGATNAGFAALSVAASDSKVTEFIKQMKDMVTWKFTWAALLSQSLSGLGKAFRSIIKDTGSLQAALQKLQSMQNYQRIFAPLLGGLAAAKLRIAELTTLSSRSPFRFDSWAKAGQTLEVFTRGAYSSAQAIGAIGDAAAATGNSMESVADATADIYDALRSGQPIAAAVEQMRKLGVASQADADLLNSLSDTGADMGSVFTELTGIIERHNGAMQGLKGNAQQAGEAYEKATEGLKAAAGAAFTEADIKNTANMTDAMNAIAPAVGRVAAFLEMLSGGFRTAGTEIVKLASQSPTLVGGMEFLAKSIGVLAAGLTLFGTLAIPSAIAGINGLVLAIANRAVPALMSLGVSFGMAATGMTILRLGLQSLVVGGGILAGVAALISLGGAVYNLSQAGNKATAEAESFSQALIEGTKVVLTQIAAVQTLTEKHEAMAAAINATAEAQQELSKAMADRGSGIDEITDLFNGGKSKAARAAKVRTAEGVVMDREHAEAIARAIPASALAPEAAQRARIGISVEREKALRDATLQAQMERSSPAGRIATLQAGMFGLSGREGLAKFGVDAAASVEARRASHDEMLGRYQSEVKDASPGGNNPNAANLREAQGRLAMEQARQLHEGLSGTHGSSIYDQTMAQMIGHRIAADAITAQFGASNPDAIRHRLMAGSASGSAADKAFYEREATRKSKLESSLPQLSADVVSTQAQIDIATKELDLAERRAEMELRISELKTKGVQRAEQEYALRIRQLQAEYQLETSKTNEARDEEKIKSIQTEALSLQRKQREERTAATQDRIQTSIDLSKQKAEITGDSRKLEGINDFQIYKEKYEELTGKGMNASDADKTARQFASNAVTLDARHTANAMINETVVDSLQRIGGGGNVSLAGNSLLDVAKRQLDLHEREVQYLQIIAEGGNGQLTIE